MTTLASTAAVSYTHLKLPVKAVTKEAVRYIPGMLAVIALIMFFPQIVEILPNLLFK